MRFTHKRHIHRQKINTHRRKNKKQRRHTKTLKGGGPAKEIAMMGTLVMYGVAALFAGSFYLLAEVLNIPMSNLNNLSRKAFNDVRGSFFHRSFPSLFEIEKQKELQEDDFLLEKDVYIHGKTSLVTNYKDPNPSFDKNGNPIQKPFLEEKDYSPGFLEKFKTMFSNPSDYTKLKHAIFRLFDYIEGIRASDAERKKYIHRIIYKIQDYKSLMKWVLIYKTIKVCAKYANEKTILRNKEVVTIVNPFYNPTNISYEERINCVQKHISQSEFDKDDICRVHCDTCTFKNSVSRLVKRYIDSGMWLAILALIASGFVSVSGILAATGVSSALSVASGAGATAGAGGVVGTATASASTAGAFGIGMASSGGAGLLLSGAAIYNIMMPTNYSTVVRKVLDSYFVYIKIENPDFLKSDLSPETVKIFKMNGSDNGSVSTNILKIIKGLKVTSSFTIDTDEKKAVMERFHRFMCKYEIDKMIDSRIAELYARKIKDGYKPEVLLEFISSNGSSPSDTLSNVVQKTREILSMSNEIKEKTG